MKRGPRTRPDLYKRQFEGWSQDQRFASAVSRMLLVAADRIPELEKVPDGAMSTLQERIGEALARVLPPKAAS